MNHSPTPTTGQPKKPITSDQEISDRLITIKEVQVMFQEAGICGSSAFYKLYRHRLSFNYYGMDTQGRYRLLKIRRSEVVRTINELMTTPMLAEK